MHTLKMWIRIWMEIIYFFQLNVKWNNVDYWYKVASEDPQLVVGFVFINFGMNKI